MASRGKTTRKAFLYSELEDPQHLPGEGFGGPPITISGEDEVVMLGSGEVSPIWFLPFGPHPSLAQSFRNNSAKTGSEQAWAYAGLCQSCLRALFGEDYPPPSLS